MASLFFQISRTDFLEALKIYDNPYKDYALRIVSFDNRREHVVYLPPVNLTELSVLVSILGLRMIPSFKHIDDVRRYWQNMYY